MVASTLRIDSGPIEAEDSPEDVPREHWRSLMLARQTFLEVTLSFDCRCLVRFVNDAELMYRELGFPSADAMIREGYGLESGEITVALEWLRLNPPNEPIALDRVRELAAHGTNQHTRGGGDNVTSSERGNAVTYTLARLRRDRPDLAERVGRGELTANAAAVEAGFRKKPTPLQTILKLLPRLTDAERQELKRVLLTRPAQ